MQDRLPALPEGAAGKAVLLLQSIAASHGAARLSELCRRTGLAKSTAYRLLATLSTHEIVVRDGNNYAISDHFLRLANGSQWASGRRLGKRLMPYLVDLHEATKQTVSLGLLSGAEVLYQERIYGRATIRTPSYNSDCAPAYCTAVGKVLLAYNRQQATAVLCRQPLTPVTPKTITDPSAFERELTAISEHGLAYSRGEYAQNVACVAAPVFGSGRTPIAAIAVTTDIATLGRGELPTAVRRVASACSTVVQRRV